MATVTPIVDRIRSAAECLSVGNDKLNSTLLAFGIPDNELGQKILDSKVTTEEDLISYLNHHYGIGTFVKPSIKAAVAILKGRDPFANQAVGSKVVSAKEEAAEDIVGNPSGFVTLPYGVQNADPVLEAVLQDVDSVEAAVIEQEREQKCTVEKGSIMDLRLEKLIGDPERQYTPPKNFTEEDTWGSYSGKVVAKCRDLYKPLDAPPLAPDSPVKIKDPGHVSVKVGMEIVEDLKKDGVLVDGAPSSSDAGTLTNLQILSGTKNARTLTMGDIERMSRSNAEQIALAMKDIRQLKDRELLDLYIKDREEEVANELHRRAKFQNWVVLQTGQHEPGKEAINVEASLDLLRSARRRTNPTMFPVGSAVVPVYKITELNINDRIIELCPICDAPTYKGYCEKCVLSFSGPNVGVGDLEKAYVHMIAQSESFDRKSFSDRRAVWASASKGLTDLYKTWPSIIKKFEEAKATDTLPRLKIIESRPSAQVADPFHVSGHRHY